MTRQGRVGLKVLVAGKELGKDGYEQLLDVHVVRVLNATASCELRFCGGAFDTSKLKMDDEVEVRVGSEGSPTSVFQGVIRTISIQFSSTAVADTVIECHDPAWKLAGIPVRAAHAKKSLGDIVGGLARDAGLSLSTDLAGSKLDYHLTAGNALEALNDIVARTGRVWYVDGDKLMVNKPTGTSCCEVEATDDLSRFDARLSSTEHVESVEVWGWDTVAKKVVSGKASSADAAYQARTDAFDSATTSHKIHSDAAIDHRYAPVDAAEANTLAQARLDRLTSARITGWGETAMLIPTMIPGKAVTIKNIGTPWSGTYPLTRVEHRVRSGEAQTRFEIGSIESAGLADLATRSRPTHRAGVTIGIVTQLWNDKQKAPRVKVKFPYFRDAQGVELESNWARIVMPGAGKGRGLFVLPEIDDEVIVAFEHGDLDRPLVVGGVWNDQDVPGLTHSDTVTANKTTDVRSFTTRKGHAWTFTDEPIGGRKSGFAVTLKNGATIEVNEEEVTVDSMKKPITITGANKSSIKIDDQGNITIQGQSITLKADQDVKIESGMASELKSGTDLKLDVGTSAEIKANVGAKFTAGAILEIKGSLVKING